MQTNTHLTECERPGLSHTYVSSTRLERFRVQGGHCHFSCLGSVGWKWPILGWTNLHNELFNGLIRFGLSILLTAVLFWSARVYICRVNRKWQDEFDIQKLTSFYGSSLAHPQSLWPWQPLTLGSSQGPPRRHGNVGVLRQG